MSCRCLSTFSATEGEFYVIFREDILLSFVFILFSRPCFSYVVSVIVYGKREMRLLEN